MENNIKTLPVIVVGKDRTLMTQHVIKRVSDGFVDVKPFIIHVSDRSCEGHVNQIQTFLDENNISGIVLETTSVRYGLGAAINIGIEYATQMSDVFFVMENDYYLRDYLRLTHVIDSIERTPVGFVSFKQVNNFNNVKCYELVDDVNKTNYIIKLKNENDKMSFTVEFGCFICHKRFFEEVGSIIENEKPPKTEETFVKTYNSLSNSDLIQKRILSCNEKQLMHAYLNAENCVFYHVGKHSSNGGMWKVPTHLEFLSE